MLDVSDSLSIDADRLARASGVVVDLDGALLEAAFGVQHEVAVPLEAMLTGGEDHGLLATFPRGTLLPAGFQMVGSVTVSDDGSAPGVRLDGAVFEPRGWDPYTVLSPGS